jgi:hypothetical protein
MTQTYPMRVRKLAFPIACLVAAISCASCTAIGPRPWEKDLMARPEMQLAPYPLQTAADEHIYFSKEASSGGRGFAGGGCGCN